MSTTNYSPAILGDPDISVLPLHGETPTASSFLIRVTTTLTRPDSLPESEDNEEDDLYDLHTARYSNTFSLPVHALDDATAARDTISCMLSSVLVPPSQQLRSSVAEKILETLIHAGRGADVAVDVYVDQLPDCDDDDDDDDDSDDNDDDIKIGFVPASKETILHLKREKIKVSSVLTCTVCLEDILVGSESICLPCSHCYHEDCIVEWLSTSKFCSICRFELS